MKASDISKSLEQLIALKQPVFLWGPPGVGKSQVVAQSAKSQGLDLI
ncbi:MAG TPA: MoxR family ATPase, partial [Desulfocapsa sulfexigens]|nr:MoxR family ATPase [Desulfocapsa sulfexigens]